MKSVQRKVTYNGLDIKLDIDINKLIGDVKEKYKPEIDILKKNVLARDRYIQKLHKEIKNKDNLMYVFIMCSKIHDKVKDLYKITYNDYMVLSYSIQLDHVKIDRIRKYFSKVGMDIKPYRFVKMIELGYMMKSPKSGYVYVTDIGKKVVNAVIGAMKQDYSYYNRNKFAKKNIIMTMNSGGKGKYSDEIKKQRSEYYHTMMRPFWDSGYKMIPKDPIKRCEVLQDWIRYEPEVRSSELYTQLLAKWQKALETV